MSATRAASPRRPPSQLGRFRILRKLGQGAQGEVFLALDTHLNRQVALKTIAAEATGARAKAAARDPMEEARIVGQLNHPCIVPLYDAGEDRGIVYLVFEYVEGETLSARLRARGALPPAEAADIAAQIAGALAYAHARGVMHRDIKPANIMLAGNVARLMDFGIARLAHVATSGDELTGTPGYMAPECLAGEAYTTAADVFSLGAMLYEMLTGKRPLESDNAFVTMQRQLTESIPAPSANAGGISEQLDAIVLKAVARTPAQRYTGAQQMGAALLAWLDPTPEGDEGAVHGPSTLQFLLRRMRHKSDFPALSAMISTVNRAASSESDPLSHLSNSILKDFALTNKLLKLVNTAHFGQFSGSISTVSKAIVILGFESVRQIAVTLLLFEHLQNKSQATQLRDEMLASYFSGLLGRELVSQAGIRDAEEAFICSLFHSLGRLLTAYYLHDEFERITRLQQTQDMSEARAAAQVLGLSFEDLGIGVARAWHFPDRLVNSMRTVVDDKAARPASADDRLRIVAALSNELAGAMREPQPEQRQARIAAIQARYGSLGVDARLIGTVTQAAVRELTRDAAVFGVAAGSSPLLGALNAGCRQGRAGTVNGTPNGTQSGTDSPTDALNRAVGDVTLAATESAAAGSGGEQRGSVERSAILTAGIQDITNSLVGDYQLNDVLRMILETMYRGIGFTRVLLCIRDPAMNVLRGRFGFGPEIDQILKRGFQVPLTASRDAFHAAVSNGADVYIDDIDGERIRHHIPGWYRKTMPARSLALFPVLVNRKPVALFYGDCDRPGELQFGAGELNLLKTLRNQAVLAIRSRS